MARFVFVNRFFYPDQAATSLLLSDLAFWMADKGSEVYVIASRQRYDGPGAGLPRAEVVKGVKVLRIWTSAFGRHWLPGRALDYLTYYLSVFVRALVTVRKGDVVVAKTDPPLISIVVAAVALLKGATLINWSQDVFPEIATVLGVQGMQGWPITLLCRVRDASWRAAQCNVVLGSHMAEILKNRHVQAKCVRVIHNWVPLREVQPIARNVNPLRERWGLDGKFVVGYSGNMGRVHEFGTILDAASALKDDDRIVFLFIGGGVWRPWIDQELTKRGLTNVRFAPFQPLERLAQCLSALDAHLVSPLPQLEGLVVPSKFYGALAAGRPVLYVGDERGEVASIVREERVGHVFSVGDSQGLAGAVKALARSEDAHWQRTSRRARVLYERRFARADALQQWNDVLQSAVQRARRRGPSVEGEVTQHTSERRTRLPITSRV